MYEGRYAYCSVIVDKKFSSTICISKSVFPNVYLFLSVFFQSVFIQSVSYRNVPDLLSFASLFLFPPHVVSSGLHPNLQKVDHDKKLKHHLLLDQLQIFLNNMVKNFFQQRNKQDKYSKVQYPCFFLLAVMLKIHKSGHKWF